VSENPVDYLRRTNDVAGFAAMVRARGGVASDGPISGFDRGWSVLPLNGDAAHWWIKMPSKGRQEIGRNGRQVYFRALCGLSGATTVRAMPLGQGNHKRCKNCQRKANKGFS